MSGDLQAGDLRSRCSRRNDPVPLPAGWVCAPVVDASAVGGPGFGVCVGSRGEEALGELADWLGCSLWIVSPEGYVWYGDIEGCSLMWGESLGVTLGRWRTKVKVVYTDNAPGAIWRRRDDVGGEYGEHWAVWVARADDDAQGPMRAAQARRCVTRC